MCGVASTVVQPKRLFPNVFGLLEGTEVPKILRRSKIYGPSRKYEVNKLSIIKDLTN